MGALLAPLVASFFVPRSLANVELAHNGAPTRTGSPATTGVEPAAGDDASDPASSSPTRFHTAYFILAACMMPTLLWLTWKIRARAASRRKAQTPNVSPTKTSHGGDFANDNDYDDSAPLLDTDDTTPATPSPPSSVLTPSQEQRVALLMGLFLLLYVGCETGWGIYLATYAVRQLAFTPQQASLLTSAYWTAFTSMRFLAIFLSTAMTADRMLMLSLGTCWVALLTVAAMPASRAVLWGASCLYGLGTASIFPTAVVWLQDNAPIDARTMSRLLVMACLGDAVVPFIQGLTLSAGGGTAAKSVSTAATDDGSGAGTSSEAAGGAVLFVYTAVAFVMFASACFLFTRAYVARKTRLKAGSAANSGSSGLRA